MAKKYFVSYSQVRRWTLKYKENGIDALWNPSYFVATVSENTEEQIRKYINNQKKQVK
ncbi:transposase [Clostridioides difficile]|uniref:transposase n=1 Tax=Clostridioides difficile TaxID=1496 RepID=UPI003AA9632A